VTRRAALAMGAASLATLPQFAAAAAARLSGNIMFIIPVGPGGGGDIYSRLIGAGMEAKMGNGVHVVPFNVAAGGGGKGVRQLYRARPDGRTIGMLSLPSLFVLQHVRKVTEDFTRFSWLCNVTKGEPYGLAVRYESPLRSLADLQTLSRTREVTLTASGPEGVAYFVTIIASRLLGLRIRLITGYRNSSDYVTGAIRGDADAVVAGLSVIRRMQRGKTLRLLASFEEHSSFPGIPDATTLGLPDLAELTALRVIAAPPGLPAEIEGELADALLSALTSPQVRAFAARNGDELDPRPPEATRALVQSQQRFFARWQSALDEYQRRAFA
jgi:tripartite-type tricarboxylate transporter receptor subunit TctC